MLRRENDLRLCAETQAAFRAVSSDPAGWLGVVETLQRRVCAEFGLSARAGLNVLRRAPELLPGDEEVFELSLYRKYNRCRDGNLRVGDPPPDAQLHPVTMVSAAAQAPTAAASDAAEAPSDAATSSPPTSLHALLESLPSHDSPLVVLAASYT